MFAISPTPKFSKWTPVDVAMPGRGQSVITFSEDGAVGAMSAEDVAVDRSVILWMPLPSVPPTLASELISRFGDDSSANMARGSE